MKKFHADPGFWVVLILVALVAFALIRSRGATVRAEPETGSLLPS